MVMDHLSTTWDANLLRGQRTQKVFQEEKARIREGEDWIEVPKTS